MTTPIITHSLSVERDDGTWVTLSVLAFDLDDCTCVVCSARREITASLQAVLDLEVAS
jgi:hypothetical protein